MEKVTRAMSTAHGEEVLDEADPVPRPDERDVEVLVEEEAVGLDDREQQDGEAPHGEEVGQARDRPLQELALAGDLDGLGLHLAAEGPPGPVGVLLPGADELGQPVETAGGNAESDDRDQESNDDSDGHECSSPISDRRTGKVAECERHLGFRCGPEDSGATTSGRSWGVLRRPLLPPATPGWMPLAGHLETSRFMSSAWIPEDARGRRATPCHRPRRATFVPHRTDFWIYLAVFGHRQIAFTQRVEFPRSRGRSSEAEHQLPKLRTRVRFSSPALH